jgi:hypothetical protein
MSEEKSFEQVFSEIFTESWQILVDRQAKYGNMNIEQLGLYGVLSRVANDKMSRVMKSMNGTIVNGKVLLDVIENDHSDEAIEDALFDIANYALIAVSLRRGLWGKPLEENAKWEMTKKQSLATKSSTLASTAQSGSLLSGISARKGLQPVRTERNLNAFSKPAES